MVSISSSPCEVLEMVFQNINQHQALVMAPLQSKLYILAKGKLYKNIHVYSSGDLKNDDNKEPNKQLRKYPKNINNIKTNEYTIISSRTFERYLTRMDGDMKITSLDIVANFVASSDSLFKHFNYIKNLELIWSCTCTLDDYLYTLGFHSFCKETVTFSPTRNSMYYTQMFCMPVLSAHERKASKIEGTLFYASTF
ncbi:hypothetical protein KGF57_002190 [Candida theae]|uniref:Uncharacterized protein n=1 Tax=Candida theae TaxID=1198502 RepID=A0AAD5FZ40_9ASCO|nr:uncharacterized protein KGF57_002190 [Candida theae]KAI5959252.1 hypothetical protein KGF57_002190 [Candida theae]